MPSCSQRGRRQRLPGDWTARYGNNPVLIETFVETPRYTGAVYRASGWIPVGTVRAVWSARVPVATVDGDLRVSVRHPRSARSKALRSQRMRMSCQKHIGRMPLAPVSGSA